MTRIEGMKSLAEIIRIENVSKIYDEKTVLNNINQVFYKGQSVAFVGYNGCGKSTLLKIIAKLITPTSGKVVYKNRPLFHYIPEKFPAVPLTAREYLLRMGAISGMGKKEAEHSVEILGRDFFLDELLDIQMRVLSKGTLQKVGVIQALLKRPDILLLDEPLSGQDVESQKVFIEKVNQLRAEDVTVFMACHEEKLVNRLAEDVYTIKNGVLAEYEPEVKRTYFILLENGGNLRPTDGMIKYGRYYGLKVEEEVCDRILPELLGRGWKLRGMEYEKNH